MLIVGINEWGDKSIKNWSGFISLLSRLFCFRPSIDIAIPVGLPLESWFGKECKPS